MLGVLDRLLIGGALLFPYIIIASAFIAMLLPGGGGGGEAPAEYIVTLTQK